MLAVACAAPTPQPPGGASSDQPKAGGKLTLWVTQDPTGWDPTIQGVSSVSDRWVTRNYNSVLTLKSAYDVTP